MDLVMWRDSFLVGNEKVDGQHKNLVKLINDLYNALGSKDQMTIGNVFNELFKYTVEHFTAEEKIMSDYKYPGIQTHKLEHQGFVNKVKELKLKFDKGDSQARLETLNFLKDWLLNHIICVDKKVFETINK